MAASACPLRRPFKSPNLLILLNCVFESIIAANVSQNDWKSSGFPENSFMMIFGSLMLISFAAGGSTGFNRG